MKKRLIISLAIGFIGIALVISYNIYTTKPLFDNARKNTKTSSFLLEPQVFEPEYANLFKPEALAKIKVLATTKNTARNIFQSCQYDDQFELYITKLNIQDTRPLQELLNIEVKPDVSASRDVVYSEEDGRNLLLNLSGTGESKNVSRIFLSIETAMKNQSAIKSQEYTPDLIGYNLSVKALSLQYNAPNTPVDFYFSAYETYSAHEGLIDLLFYRKGKDVYVLFMYPHKKDIEMPQGFLKQLILVQN